MVRSRINPVGSSLCLLPNSHLPFRGQPETGLPSASSLALSSLPYPLSSSPALYRSHKDILYFNPKQPFQLPRCQILGKSRYSNKSGNSESLVEMINCKGVPMRWSSNQTLSSHSEASCSEWRKQACFPETWVSEWQQHFPCHLP